MTDKDRMIRRMWLLSYIIIAIGETIYGYSQQMTPQSSSYQIYGLSFTFVILLIGIYIYYYCAYKKPGTKLLTLSLIITPIFLVFNIVMLAKGWVDFKQSGLHPLHIIPAIWIYVLTWKMRKINKKLQKA